MRRGLAAPLIKLVIFLVVTALATLVLASTISTGVSGKTLSYRADFTSITGVTVGDDVRIAGVRVGQIESMKLVSHNLAELKFSVQADRRLATSTLAVLKFRNLVGTRYLSLDQGSGNANELLPPGGTIPVKQTTDALDLTQLLGSFQPLEQLIDPQQLNSLAGELIQTFQGTGGSIDLLIQQFGDVLNAVGGQRDAITSLITNLNSVLGTVAQHNAQLDSMLTDLTRWVSGLSQDRNEIGDSLTGIGTLAASLTDLLDKARPPLANDVKQLNALGKNLNDNSKTISGALQSLPSTTTTLGRVSDYGGWMNFYLCSFEADDGLLGFRIHGTVANGTPPGCSAGSR